MKKYLFIVLAVLLMASVANATVVPGAVDAKAGPEVWVTSVYNNSGGSLAEGDLLVWQIGSSTGDDDNYVTTTTTADTHLVAGVVYKAAIATASRGLMALKGVAPIDVLGSVVDGSILCSSATAGEAGVCSDDAYAIGHAVASGDNTTVNAFIYGR